MVDHVDAQSGKLTNGGAVPGAWLSVSELAAVKGITKQAISKRLAKLRSEQLITIRRRGREKTVNLAEWDAAVGETTDPARLVAQETRRAVIDGLDDDQARNLAGTKASGDPTYTAELTRKAGFEADLKKLQLERERGEVLQINDVRRAAERIAEDVVRGLELLPAHADEIHAAGALNGVAGTRTALRERIRAIRATLAESMQTLAAASAQEEEHDDEQETDDGGDHARRLDAGTDP